MPCEKGHIHPPWPTQGRHELLIHGCEIRCGWCDYKTRQANNLRVHARRHIANPNDENLKHITIAQGKAGRSRVQMMKSQESSLAALPSFSIINKGLDITNDCEGPSRSTGPQPVEIPLATDWTSENPFSPARRLDLELLQASIGTRDDDLDRRDRLEGSEVNRSSISLPQQRRLPSNGPVIYGDQFQASFENQNQSSPAERGKAQQLVAPEIDVEFAPLSRQSSFEPQRPSILGQHALMPSERGQHRRDVLDMYNHPSSTSHLPSPSGLSPAAASDDSRGAQGAWSFSFLGRSATSSPSQTRRQSTPSLPTREYILGLADPDHQSSRGNLENGTTIGVQKHSATFDCNLCPKRFTRAYNLRSHLRTHTDERPFVCTVCGKAFSRQRDRKFHEGLHSGEKTFVCKGNLKQGGQWGCGRRFARADALGRHFQSEAGRICIKPLLDEESMEKQRTWQEKNMYRMQNTQHQSPSPMGVDSNGFLMDTSGNYTLPTALLTQYPALATLSWSELPHSDATMEDVRILHAFSERR